MGSITKEKLEEIKSEIKRVKKEINKEIKRVKEIKKIIS